MLKTSEIKRMVTVPIFFALKGFLAGGLILFLSLAVTGPALAQSGTWKTLSPMTTARYGAAAGVIDGKIYVASGVSALGNYGGIWTNTTEVYDPITNTWTNISPIPINTEEGAAGVINGKLYVAGGSSSQYAGNIANLQIYDPATNEWTSGASMPLASHHMAAGVIDGKLYVAGGTDQSNIYRTNSLRVYDPSTNAWSIKAPMPTIRFAAAAGVINGILYVVGGDSSAPWSSLNPTNIVEAYDPATDIWTTKAPMPTSRTQHCVAVMNGILYALGGWGYDGNRNQVTYETVEAYDPVSDTWITSYVYANGAPRPISRGYRWSALRRLGERTQTITFSQLTEAS